MIKSFINDRLQTVSIRGLILLTGALLGLFIAYWQPQSSNTWSRVATVRALVERGTLSVDQDPATSSNVDKAFVRGHFYSDKPPTLTLLASAVYYPLYRLGMRLTDGRNPVYWFITFLLISGSTLLCLAAFHQAAGLVGLNEKGRLWMTAGLAFATVLLSWSTTINNHSFSAAWVFIAFFLLFRAKLASARAGPTPERIPLWALLAGGAVGLAAAADTACALFVVGYAGYMLASRPLRRGLPWYLGSAFLVMLPGLAVSHALTNDFRPIAGHAEYFYYPGSPWLSGPDRLSGFERNSIPFALNYALLALFGPSGFLLYNPLLFIAIFEAVRSVAARRKFWQESLLVLVLCGIFTGYFFLYSSNYGGGCFSVRWFVTLVPLLWLFAFPFFMNWTPARRNLYLALGSAGMFFAMLGAVNPWSGNSTSFHDSSIAMIWRYSLRPELSRLAHELHLRG
jgi:hypothetical protein